MTSAFATGPERDAWLRERRKGIGGSDAPILMGLSAFTTPFLLYCEKIREDDDMAPESEQHESAYWGHVLEDVVAQEFQKRTGLEVHAPEESVEVWSEDHSYMRASIDRYVWAYAHPSTFLECKTRSSFAEKYWATDVPLDVKVQVQHTMTVLEKDHAYVAALIGGQKFLWYRLEHDPALEAEILAAEAEFWDRVRRREPPPQEAKDATDLQRRFGRVDNAKRVKLDDAFAEQIRVYDALQQEKKYVEGCMAGIEASIKAAMGDAGRAMYRNRIAATWLEESRRVLDVAALERDHATLAHGYYTTQVERVLKVKGIRGDIE